MYNNNKIINLVIGNDFISFLKKIKDFSNQEITEFNFNNELKLKSFQFKKIIYDLIQKKYPNEILDLRISNNNDYKYNRTIEGITNKKKIIFSPVLEGNILGSKIQINIDLLIHKSLVFDFFENKEYINELKNEINNSEYHIISHIKCKKIKLLKNNLEGDANLKTEKIINVLGQILLEQILKKEVNIGFVLGREYLFKDKTKLFNIEYLSIVHEKNNLIRTDIHESINLDYMRNSKIKELTKAYQYFDIIMTKYIKYYENSSNEKSFFEAEDIIIPNAIIKTLVDFDLMPNMKIDSTFDENYYQFKKDFAKEIKEITLLPHCTTNERYFAINKNLFNFDMVNDVILDLGRKPGKQSNEIQTYLDKNYKYFVSSDTLNIFNKNQLHIYIDLETILGIITEDFGNIKKPKPALITVIGIVVVFLDEIHDIQNFVIKNLDQKSEAENVNEFIDYLKELQKEFFNLDFNLIHYTKAEIVFFKTYSDYNKYSNMDNNIYLQTLFENNSIDLHKIIHDENIYPKYTLNKKLKTIAKAYYKEDLIPQKWENSDIDGQNSMIYTKVAFQTKEGREHKYIKDVIEYNTIDCLVMFFIVYYWKYEECYPLIY